MTQEDEDIKKVKALAALFGVRMNDEEFSLFAAVEDEDIEKVKALLDIGVNVNVQDNDGNTALMFACMYNLVEIAELLLAHKDIDVNIQNKNGDTAFMIAIWFNNKKIVELLLKKKDIDIFIKNNVGWNGLDYIFNPNKDPLIDLALECVKATVNKV